MTILDQLKARSAGYLGKMIISDKEMSEAQAEGMKLHGVRAAPVEDLRYIEGLLDLPYGFVKSFFCIPDSASSVCSCGREPSPADIVAYALRKNIHSKQVIRDAVIGLENIFEPSEGGREAPCLKCGSIIRLSGYWTHRYYYV
jgi:hypothetical protein